MRRDPICRKAASGMAEAMSKVDVARVAIEAPRLTPPPFSPKDPPDDHAPPLHPQHDLVALDRDSGGAMAWVLTM